VDKAGSPLLEVDVARNRISQAPPFWPRVKLRWLGFPWMVRGTSSLGGEFP
jgi:hypothetical protein